MDRGHSSPAGLSRRDLRRIFIGLYPSVKGLARIRQIVDDLPRSLHMENPEDLHVTILFGGDQLSRQEPLWNRATLRTAQALDPLSRLPMRDFFLERRRSILAIRFFGSDPFWKVVDGLATDLSGELLGLFSTRTFWPHMTLCRRIPPKMHDADCPMPRAHSPGDSPFFAGVRLYASPDPEERGRKRYITLSDFPFRQEQHGI